MTDRSNTISTDKLPENQPAIKPAPKKKAPVKKTAPKKKASKKYRAMCNHINPQRNLFIQKGDVYTEEQYNALPERIQRSFEEFTVKVEIKEG